MLRRRGPPCSSQLPPVLLLASPTHSLLSASSPITTALRFRPPTHPQHHHQVPWPRFPSVHAGQHPEGPPALLCPHVSATVLPQGHCTCCPQPASVSRAPHFTSAQASPPRRSLRCPVSVLEPFPLSPHPALRTRALLLSPLYLVPHQYLTTSRQRMTP